MKSNIKIKPRLWGRMMIWETRVQITCSQKVRIGCRQAWSMRGCLHWPETVAKVLNNLRYSRAMKDFRASKGMGWICVCCHGYDHSDIDKSEKCNTQILPSWWKIVCIYVHTHIYVHIYVWMCVYPSRWICSYMVHVGIFQKEMQEDKRRLVDVISGQWNWVCGWKRDVFYHIPPALFEFAFHVHENIFIITKKACTKKKKKCLHACSNFKSSKFCPAFKKELNITHIQRLNYRSNRRQISINKWFTSSCIEPWKRPSGMT